MLRIKQVLLCHTLFSEKGTAKILVVNFIQNIIHAGFYLSLLIQKALSQHSIFSVQD